MPTSYAFNSFIFYIVKSFQALMLFQYVNDRKLVIMIKVHREFQIIEY